MFGAEKLVFGLESSQQVGNCLKRRTYCIGNDSKKRNGLLLMTFKVLKFLFVPFKHVLIDNL